MKKMKKVVAILAFALLAVCMTIQPAEAKTIKLSTNEVFLEIGQSKTIKVKGTSKKVTWKSSKPKVATVSKKGKVTAKKVGSAKIYAKVSGKTLKCKVEVLEPEFNVSTLKIPQNSSYQLKLDNASYGTIKWSSSNQKVATVSSKGLVTVGSRKGTSKVRALYRDKYYTCNVTVINYKDNYNDFKEQISKSSQVDEDGNHYIGIGMGIDETEYASSLICRVYYLEAEDTLKFVYTVTSDFYDDLNGDGEKELVPSGTTVCMYLNFLKSGIAKADVECYYKDKKLVSTSDVDVAAFTEDTEQTFDDISYDDDFIKDYVTDKTYHDDEDWKYDWTAEEEKDFASMLCEEYFSISVYYWNAVLYNYTDYSMSDFGFIGIDV